MKDDVLVDLVRDASALIEADRKVVKSVVESQIEDFPKHLTEFRDIKLRVLRKLGEYGVIDGINNQEKEILLRAQRKFPSDHILEQLSEEREDEAFYYTLSDDEISDLGSDLLYSWISHYEYVRDIFKVNSLILQTTIPSEVATYVREARDCFAFQQYNAVVSMCRTILEAAAKDLCEKQGFFAPPGKNNPRVFNQLISAVCKGALKRRAVGIYYSDGCPVVHGDRAIDAGEALRVVRETLDVVQNLYFVHEAGTKARIEEESKEPA